MEDFFFGLGILLAVLGPLLLVPVVWLAYRLLVRPLVVPILARKTGEPMSRLVGMLLSASLVAAVVAASYFPGKWEFDRLCRAEGIPVIRDRVWADGFYRTRLYPYEARLFLGPEKFAFVEGPDMYHEGRFFRYRLDDQGQVQAEEVTEPISRYGIRDVFDRLAYGISKNDKIVYEIASGRELGRASSVLYEGGRLSWVLGVYGMSSCPDPHDEQGAEHFRTYYDFETIVLRDPRGR